jgi:tetratricopeptide (TPR) repeat protein
MKHALAFALLLAAAAPAHANKADDLFDQGQKAMKQKEYAEACEAFEESDKLDPGIGVKLNAARCYEEWGKLARAYQWYVDALKLAEKAGDKRGDKVKEILAGLDQEVPKLLITVPPNSDLEGGAIMLDGRPLDSKLLGSEFRVDPGPHELEWHVGGEKKTKTLAFERGASREVTIELDPAPVPVSGDGTTQTPIEPVKDPEVEKVGQTRKLISFVLVGAGAVALGVSGALTLDARGTYKDALAEHCGGSTNMCTPEGLDITHSARSRANAATGVAIFGLAAVGAGIALYLTAPKPEADPTLSVGPILAPDTTGFAVSGSF